jgi:hypothetical protein
MEWTGKCFPSPLAVILSERANEIADIKWRSLPSSPFWIHLLDSNVYGDFAAIPSHSPAHLTDFSWTL